MHITELMNTPTELRVGNISLSVCVLTIADLSELNAYIQAIAVNKIYEPGNGVMQQPEAVRTPLIQSWLSRAYSLSVLTNPADPITRDLKNSLLWHPDVVVKRIVLAARRGGSSIEASKIKEAVHAMNHVQFHALIDDLVEKTIDRTDANAGKTTGEGEGAAPSNGQSSPPASATA